MAERASCIEPAPGALHALYQALLDTYGPQSWWPAESAFEVVVGAVLTQNTAWSNVEKAIDRLKTKGLLSLQALLGSDQALLAETIRPSGYFNTKAKRLRNLCRFLDCHGGLEAFARLSLDEQRSGLLTVNGVGPETADDILLYALQRPVFVIDTYTRRLLCRFGLAQGDESYEELRAAFERTLPLSVELYQQYHALIVMHAKASCHKTPACDRCALWSICPTGRAG